MLFVEEGNTHQVLFSLEQHRMMRGNILLHNHPGDGGFSVADVMLAMRWRAHELRVITSRYRYVLTEPDSGWSIAFWNDVVLPVFTEEQMRIDRKLRPKRKLGSITQQQYTEQGLHELWSSVAEKVGMHYSRERLR